MGRKGYVAKFWQFQVSKTEGGANVIDERKPGVYILVMSVTDEE